MPRPCRPVLLALLAAALAAPSAQAAVAIPGQPLPKLPAFEGAVATPHPVAATAPPRHPYMAPNERSNIHDDAYQTDTYRTLGPLGRGGVSVRSTFFAQECASVTFDRRGRLVTVCVGLATITLRILDPVTLDTIASYDLPGRDLLSDPAGAFTNFSGGGYFYLDDQDRAVVPTANRHVVVVAIEGDRLRLVADHDLTGAVPSGDGVISALPDWSGRIWFASKRGVVGTIDPATGAVRSVATGEPIGNSFAVDETGGVFIVTDRALERFDAGSDGTPTVAWRETYENIGTQKTGQTQAGSGTTPTLFGRGLVAITDNADPMHVLVYRRGRDVTGSRLVCSVAVFARGASVTDQSLIATDRSLVVENNAGYTVTAVEGGRTTAPGLARVDLLDGGGCRVRWTAQESAPSVVPKLSLPAGLIYTYTKPARSDGADAWYLTALDFATGRRVFRVLSGGGLGYNNNYAPVTIGPDRTAYVGVLGGIVAFRDLAPPPAGTVVRGTLRPRLRIACAGGDRVRARVTGAGVRRVVFIAAGRRVVDARAPFAARLRARGRRVSARVSLVDGRVVHLRARAPRCLR